MREILFRGKSTIDGRWKFGYLAPITYNARQRGWAITDKGFTSDEDVGMDCWVLHEEVVPNTVGQYTGLTDKNGKKIFEGDILYYEFIYSNPTVYVVTFEHGAFSAREYRKGEPEEIAYAIDDYEFGVCVEMCKVVGNIHDNPELLGGR